ncbi:hypothetical protein [Arthrobacter humicola]
MKKLLAAGAIAGLVLLGGGLAPANAAPPEGQLCPEWDTGRIDVADGIKSLEITAPDGLEIIAVCVKAGSAKQGLGAQIDYFYSSQLSVTISHYSGKDISHYSVMYGEPSGS